MNKAQLEAYYIALHDALEREVVEVPKTKAELRYQIGVLRQRLLQCPDGERQAAEAYSGAKNGN